MLTLSTVKRYHIKHALNSLLKINKKNDVVFFLNKDVQTQSKEQKILQCNVGIRNVSNGFSLPPQAQVVICGGGVVANSVAYHLIENGWKDIVVLEQGSICGGTSHFGSGTLGLFKPLAEKNVINNSVQLYRTLQERGYDIGLKQCGSLNIAQTKDRMIFLKRRMSCHKATGVPCELLGPQELKRLHPFMNTEDLEGAVWVPEDAVCNPKAICHTLASLASEGGARYFEHCTVDKILTKNGRVAGVVTNMGNMSCEIFVNCAGMHHVLGQHDVHQLGSEIFAMILTRLV